MKHRKWYKLRASKQQFPTRQIDGDRKTHRKGALVLGHVAARAHLETTMKHRLKKLGFDLSKAVVKSTSHEWVFKFPLPSI